MDEQEFERYLERLMKQDFSKGTEAFRDELLARCLAVLKSDDGAMPLDDSDIELLAAAGGMPEIDPRTLENPATPAN